MTPSPGVAFLGDVGLALAAALLGGLVARALRLPTLIGYLLAGILVGPHTPGLIADEAVVHTVADLGVALLMFAVGMQFSLEALRPIRRTVLRGGTVQLFGMVLLGIGLSLTLGWGLYAGIFVGCALALSSTAVMLRLLDEQGELRTAHGQLLSGFLVFQDFSLVVMAVLLPALADLGAGSVAVLAGVGGALLKALLFLGGTLFLAQRVVPYLLERIAQTGSRELLLLASVCLCLGTGFVADRLGLGLPLGTFIAGLVLSSSPYAQAVLAQVRPLRDVFSSLFFVSVGMLLNPAFVLQQWGAVLATVLTIVVGKPLVVALSLMGRGESRQTTTRVALGLAQIGEFSFVLTSLGAARGLIREELSGILLASALLTLLLTPVLYRRNAPSPQGC